MGDTQFDDEMRGALFRNDDKQEGDKRPDYKGYVIVGGNRLELAAWLRTSQRTGRKFMSLKLEVPQPKQTQGATPAPTQAQPVQATPVAPPSDFGDDPPF